MKENSWETLNTVLPLNFIINFNFFFASHNTNLIQMKSHRNVGFAFQIEFLDCKILIFFPSLVL